MLTIRVAATSLAASLLSQSACESSGNELGYLSAIPDEPIEDVERVAFDDHLRAVCGPHETTAGGEARLVRAPYLQRTTHESVVLAWVSTGNEAARVEVTAPDGSPVGTFEAVIDPSARPDRGRQFVAAIGDLSAETVYCYRVQERSGATWISGGFSTPPMPGADAVVRFSALGDVGKRSSDQYEVLGQLESVPSDFVLLTGDIAYDSGTRSELEANFFGVYGDMMAWIPFFPAAGNHDYRTEDAGPFREAFVLFENGAPQGRERWYSFDWGPVHVVVLDTDVDLELQRDWLDRDLASSRSAFTVAVMHRPPFSSGTHGSDARLQQAFVPLFERHGVELVLAGHDHNYERTRSINGVIYVVTGGGGRGTREVAESDFTAYSARVAHFVHVTIAGETLRLVAIDATGQPFDAVEISQRG